MAISLDSRAVVSTDEARAALGIGEGLQEDALRLAVNRATYRLEAYTRVALVQKSYVERYTGTAGDGRSSILSPEGFLAASSKFIYLRHYPVASVTSIVDEQTTPESITGADYYLRKEQGILEHYSVWPTPYKQSGTDILPGEWIITYVAGWFASVSAVTWDVKDACLQLVAEALYRSSGSVNSISSGSLSVSFGGEPGEALPASVRSGMSRYRIGRVS